MKLNKDFFNRHSATVARQLLGKFLVRQRGRTTIAAMITETEAYHGPYDRASHASKGLTERTRVMFGPPGTTYVYLIYGMYHCLNFVTMREKFPAAVLIRAVALPNGNGPGKVCRLMYVDRKLNNLPLGSCLIWIEDRGVHMQKRDVETLKRVGVDYAGLWRNKLWRFRMKSDTLREEGGSE